MGKIYKRHYATGGAVIAPNVTRQINPYTGLPFPDYGYGPEFNWYDYLYGPQGQTPGAPATNSSGIPTPSPNPSSVKPSAPSAAGISTLLGRLGGGRSGDADREGRGGGPIREIDYRGPLNDPYAGGGGLGLGGIASGIAGGFGPGGAIGSNIARSVFDKNFYDTKTINIPGFGGVATNFGPLAAFSAAIPGATFLGNTLGRNFANNLRETIQNGTGDVFDLRSLGGDIGVVDESGAASGYYGAGEVGRQNYRNAIRQARANRAARAQTNAARSISDDIATGRIQEDRATRAGAPQSGGGSDRDRGGNRSDQGNRARERDTSKGGGGHSTAFAKGGQVKAEDAYAEVSPYNVPTELPDESFENPYGGESPYHESSESPYEELAEHGRGADSDLAHVTPGELVLPPEFLQSNPELTQAIFSEMRQDGIDPDEYIVGFPQEGNPDTGLDEFGFFKSVKKIGKKVLPVAIGAGTSYLTGSDILGGLAGGVSSKLLGNSLPTALLTGLGTGIASNALGLSDNGGAGLFGPSGALGFLNNGESLGSSLLGGRGSAQAAAATTKAIGEGAGQAAKESSGSSGLLGGYGLPLLAGAGGLLALAGSKQPKQPKAATPGINPAYDNTPFDPNIVIDRDAIYPTVDWLHAGENPEVLYFNQPNPGKVRSRAEGGAVHEGPGYVMGDGDGLSDSVNARLGDGEYVIPADVVSHLGNGSSNAGSKQLDEMVRKVRSYRTNGGKKSGNKGHLPKSISDPMKFLGN